MHDFYPKHRRSVKPKIATASLSVNSAIRLYASHTNRVQLQSLQEYSPRPDKAFNVPRRLKRIRMDSSEACRTVER
jgi:hypothetical protein